MSITFSQSAQAMRSSEIRRLMAMAADPSIISFAGGMPNNALFPTKEVDEIYAALSTADKQVAFQYSPTPGHPALLESLKAYLRTKGLPLDGNGLLITTGAQQAINLTAKVLLDPGDIVLTEYPSFIGALAAFKSYGAELVGTAMDSDGIVIDELRATIQRLPKPAKVLYINTHFHNPAGIVYSPERKKQLLDLLTEHNICLLEDDPYGELYFDAADAALTVPIKAMASEKVPICYTGSFAKIFGPGMRLGWLLAPQAIYDKCELAKQSMDACTGAFTQVLAHEYLSRGKLPGYLSSVRTAYKRRAGIMLDALKATMPEGVTWTTPRGGFFVWVTLTEDMDATHVFNASLKKGAAFVIGSAFDPEGRRNNCFRLAFSHTPEERIAEGVAIVAGAVRG